GVSGLWMAWTERVYGHTHPHGSRLHVGLHSHWHLHVGSPHHHPQPQRHSHVPTLVGAVFAVSGLRALTLLTPFGDTVSRTSIGTLLGLILVFAAGVLLSMSLFRVVLARTLRTPPGAVAAGPPAPP